MAAWLLREEAGVATLRVADPFSERPVVEVTLPLPEVVDVQPWDHSSGSVVAGDALWRLDDDFLRTRIDGPTDYTGAGHLCGNVSEGGALLDDGQLYELRDGFWWGWSPSVTAPASAPARLLTRDGECTGPDNVLWAMGNDGALWGFLGNTYPPPLRFPDGATSGAAAANYVSILDGTGTLWTGRPDAWTRWRFDSEGVPSAVHASGNGTWTHVGSDLYHFDGSRFALLELELSDVSVVLPHRSGVWVGNHTDVCHHAFGPSIRVDGLRPNVRTQDPGFFFRAKMVAPTAIDVASSGVGATSVTTSHFAATINGTPLSVTEEGDGWYRVEGMFPNPGWHTLRMTAQGDEHGATRAFHVKQEPEVVRSWNEDVKPIFAAHCDECHGADATLTSDLSTFEHWVRSADAIHQRVVQSRTMPPASSQQDDWGDENVAVIADWFEGGMLP